MKSVVFNTVVSFLIGFGLAYWLLGNPEESAPVVENIDTMQDYAALFEKANRIGQIRNKRSAPSTIIEVRERVITRVDTIRVPIKAEKRDLRLFYGDIRVSQDRITLGTFNPATGLWQADVFEVPRPRFTFHGEAELLYPLGGSLGAVWMHRSGIGAVGRVSYHEGFGAWYSVGVRVRF